jgi:hypothetical protein
MHLQVSGAISQHWLILGCITIHWPVSASSEVLVWGAFKKNSGMSVAIRSPVASYYLVYTIPRGLSSEFFALKFFTTANCDIGPASPCH